MAFVVGCCGLVPQLCLTLCDPMDCSLPGSMGFPRQEYWSRLSFPPPRDLPHPGTESAPPALAGGFFTLWNLESPHTKTGNIEPTLFNEKTLRNFELEHDTLGQGQHFPGSTGSITCWSFLFQLREPVRSLLSGTVLKIHKDSSSFLPQPFPSMLNISRSINCLSWAGLFACLLPSGGQKGIRILGAFCMDRGRGAPMPYI